jgi:excinuclease ABC subunit C
VGGCTVADYDQQLALARAFLDGFDAGPVDMLRQQMEAASDALEFERAALFRDKLSRLESLRDQFDRMRFAVETLSFVYNVSGCDGRDRTYVIRRGVIRAELETPKTRRDRAAMRRLVDDIFGEKPTPGSSIPMHEIDELMLLSSWFRKFPDEMDRASRVA